MGYNIRVKRVAALIILSVFAASSIVVFVPLGADEIEIQFSDAIYGVATSLVPGWNIWSPGLHYECDWDYLTAKDLTIIEPRIVAVVRIDETNETLNSYVRGISDAYDFRINFYDAYYVALEGDEIVTLNIPFPGKRIISYEHELRAGWNFVGLVEQDYNMWIHDWVAERIHGDVWVVAVRAYLSNTAIREDFRTYPIGVIELDETPVLQAYVTGDEDEHPAETFMLWPGIGFYLWVSEDARISW